jgi:hypothetical protein
MQQMKDAGGAKVTKPGNLYKVDLPDEHIAKMLDWDKPLSQQPNILPQGVTLKEFVAKVGNRKPTDLEKFQANLLGRVERGNLDPNYATVRNIYEGRNTNKYPSPADFSETLRSLGIPGIRYLDAGSRGSGKGSYNYVIFDADLAKIIGHE